MPAAVREAPEPGAGSTTVTDSPRCRLRQAIDKPMTPAPTTRTSGRAPVRPLCATGSPVPRRFPGAPAIRSSGPGEGANSLRRHDPVQVGRSAAGSHPLSPIHRAPACTADPTAPGEDAGGPCNRDCDPERRVSRVSQHRPTRRPGRLDLPPSALPPTRDHRPVPTRDHRPTPTRAHRLANIRPTSPPARAENGNSTADRVPGRGQHVLPAPPAPPAPPAVARCDRVATRGAVGCRR